ncbi:MAG: glycosyltransferase family 9 protein [Ignavibacteriales bacterium]|nr:glycosyltransferase family 9 protein [Ignavibacteriales bacterium]
MKGFFRPFELVLRHGFVYPFLRLLFHNPPRPEPVDLRKIKKVLILRYDRIGDIIVTTPIFRALKSAAPDLVLGVLASPSNSELIRYDRHVDRLHVLHSSWLKLAKELLAARKEGYDVVLNFIFNRTTSGGILANLIAPRGIKIGQGAEKYRFYFNRLLRLDRGQKHMVEILAGYVEEVFGISVRRDNLTFRVALRDKERRGVSLFLERHQTKAGANDFVLLNISATDKIRRLGKRQATHILDILLNRLKVFTIVISSPQDERWRRELVEFFKPHRVPSFPEQGSATLREIAALVERSFFVITPDTSIIHLASAMNKPVLGLFTPLQVTAEWMPWKVKHAAIVADAGQPVASIPLDRIEQELTTFAKGIIST